MASGQSDLFHLSSWEPAAIDAVTSTLSDVELTPVHDHTNNMIAVESATHDIASTAHRKPRTRQRIHKAPAPLDVPDINDDAAERKRVLNVLAQRRYRDRKRQNKKQACSTADLSSPNSNTSTKDDSRTSQSPSGQGSQDQAPAAFQSHMPRILDGSLGSTMPITGQGPDFDVGSTNGTWQSSAGFDSSLLTPGTIDVDSTLISLDSSEMLVSPTSLNFSDNDGTALSLSSSVDPSVLMSFYSTGSPSADSAGNMPGGSLSTDSMDDLPFPPDSYLLPMAELTLLRAFTRIAGRLQCVNTMWDLAANSPFLDGSLSRAVSDQLPQTWRPTPSQSSVPHHPVVDIIPWPSVRDRLLVVMSMPDALRPPETGGPLALVQLAYDMEDSSEGLRVWGGDVYDSNAWEVGQVLFEKWWFVFDRQVIDQSNYWRRLRGAPELTVKCGGSRVEELVV